MTVAVTVKVNDGIVIASDSASTLSRQAVDGNSSFVNIYNNANKVFNLRKGLPIGAATMGAGSIGHASIATLAKDLRKLFTEGDEKWLLKKDEYTIEQVATLAREFLYEDKYRATYGTAPITEPLKFWVCGYSAGRPLSELWEITIANGQCDPPRIVHGEDQFGLHWGGQPDPIARLVLGVSIHFEGVLRQEGLPADRAAAIIKNMQGRLSKVLCSAAMPIVDAIDLAEFLVNLTVNFSRFDEGVPVVGGPIDIAAITKHENFRWVKRKHYYPAELNPEPSHGER